MRTMNVAIGSWQLLQAGIADAHEFGRWSRTPTAGGADSVQGLELALKMIGATLYASPEAREGRLTWNCARTTGDLGFPVPDSIRDVAPPQSQT